MKFEEFEERIWSEGFGIAAMNHYSIKGERRLYCIIYNTKRNIAFMAEGIRSYEVFETLIGKIKNKKE